MTASTLTLARIEAFRASVAASRAIEETDPTPVLDWLRQRRAEVLFESHLIPLTEVKGWNIDPDTGIVRHDSGEFFSIEGVRTSAGSLREVAVWDQPIYNQKEGGILGILARQRDGVVEFLIHGKAEPGNIDTIQLSPTLQSTMSNLKQAHGGRRSLLAEYFLDETLAETIYVAKHNEEGGRFWRKSNANQVMLLRDAEAFTTDDTRFIWVTLSQIKALMLIDNLVNPFVKTILSPI